MALRKFKASDSINDIVAATLKDGASIVTNVISPKIANQITKDLRANFDNFGYRSKRKFSGHLTNRCHDVLKESPRCAELISHDIVMNVADSILLPHCESYRVGSITAIEVCPGENKQSLHRDNCIYPCSLPGMEMLISSIWALTDFTEENGATCVVPGSHRHISMGESIDISKTSKAIMPKGSVLFYLGSTFHGAGANNSQKSRIGLVNLYSLGWLRSEVNQYLSTPIAEAKKYDKKLRSLLGYTTHDRFGDRLGKYYGADASFIDKDNYAKHYRPKN